MSNNIDPLSLTRPGQDARDILLDHNRLNAWTEGARFAKRHGQGLLVDRNLQPLPPGQILVRNDTGEDLSEFNIVGFEEPVFTRDENESHFPNQTVFKAVEPEWPDHFLSWGILLDPARENAVARCLVGGIGVALVNFANSDASTGHKCATVKDATFGYLDSAPCGPARILWKESGTGQKWCKLWLGAPMPAGFVGRTSGTISAASGTNFPYTLGSGTIDVAKRSGSTYVDASWNMTVYNTVDVAVAASALIVGQYDDVGTPIVTVEPC